MGKINSKDIRFAPHGRILMGTADAPMPALPAAATAFDDSTPITGFTDLGYVSEEGAEIAPSLSTNDIPVWQSAAPATTVITGAGLTVTFRLMQFDKDTTALFFGGKWVKSDTTPVTSMLTLPSTPELVTKALIIMWGDSTRVAALYIPRAQVNEREGFTLTRTNPNSLAMTFKALDANGKLGDLIVSGDMTAG
ncbi:hypothetical protein [Nonomuraea lactucae]|uniref:phage tail tube protein n=1 Tax=Nonomuraea lactucae TaxID=2249762 RepID=UPI0013B42FCA|nr:hypothetical protein [Nonomuraea lactucae]